MRIRKRKVPLPLSLLSPIPLTDPHLFSRSPVMVVQTEAPTASSNNTVNHTSSSIIHDSQPSDHLTKSWSSDLRRLIVANTAPTHHDVMEVKGVLTNNDDASNVKLTTTKNTNGAAPHHLSPSTNEVGDMLGILVNCNGRGKVLDYSTKMPIHVSHLT